MTQNDQNIQLSLIHAFGSCTSNGLRNNVGILDDDQKLIIYPVGKFIAVKNLMNHQIQFISMPQMMEKLTGIRISFDQKYLVISWTHIDEPFPQLTLYNIQSFLRNQEKEKYFKLISTKSSQFQDISFCGEDSQFLCAATNDPDNQIICLDLQRMKIIGSINLQDQIVKIIINPKQTNLITVLSKNFIKNYKIKDDIISISPNIIDLDQNQKFVDICFFDQNILLISNDQGELILVFKDKVNQIIKNAFKDDDQSPVISIKSFNRGFIICTKQGKFGLWILDYSNNLDQPNNLIFQRRWVGDRKITINDFIISPKQDLIAISFDSNDICTFEIQQILPQNVEVLQIQREIQYQKKIRYDYLDDGFHGGPILSLDVCVYKPIIVTACRLDSTIRIWNYAEMKSELVSQLYYGDSKNNFDLNPLLSVALHPMGYYLAAGFIDKLCVYHISQKELKLFREIDLKNCNQLKFSNGGQYLAVSSQKLKPSNSYDISIFHSFTLEFIHSCKGHSAPINDLIWSPKDNFLYSCGSDGRIYEWNKINWDKHDFFVANAKFGCLALDYNQMIVAGGYSTDKNFIYEQRIRNDNNFNLNQNKSDYSNTYVQNLKLTAISKLNQVKTLSGLVLGTSDGQIKVYKETYFNKDPYQNLQIHNGSVNKIRLSADGRYIFSAGEDGSIFMFSVKNIDKNEFVEDQMPLQDPDDHYLYNHNYLNIVDIQLGKAILISKNDIKYYMDEQIKLRLQMEDFENKMEIKIQDDKVQREIERQQNREHLRNQIQKWEKKYEDLKVEKTKYERVSEQLIKNIEHNHSQVLEEVEQLYEKKLYIQIEKYQKLEFNVSEKSQIYKQIFQEQQNKYNENLKLLEQDFHQKFGQSKNLFENTKNTAQELKKFYDEIMNQQSDEQWEEIKDQKKKYENYVDQIKQNINDLKKQNLLFVTDIRNNSEEIQIIEKNEINKINKIDYLQEELLNQQEIIEDMNQRLDQEREILKEKEQKIQEQKNIISDLQKSKQVLNFRTQEMHKTLEPKEIEIKMLKDELFNLEAQFENIIKQCKENNNNILKQNDNISQQKTKIHNQEESIKKKNNQIKCIEMDIYNIVKSIDKKFWIQEMQNLYKKYVNDKYTYIQQNDPKGAEEMGNQIIHLEKSIQDIYCSSQKKIFRREQDIRKQMMGNATLIFDLNEVRKQNKTVQGQLNLKLAQINAQKNEVERLQRELTRLKKLDQDKSKQRTRILSANPRSNAERFTKIQQQYQQKLQISQGREITSAKGSKNARGKIFKGANWDTKTLCAFEKARVLDLIVENQSQVQKLHSLETDFNTVNNAVSRHQIDQQCKIDNFEYQEQSGTNVLSKNYQDPSQNQIEYL